MNQITPRENILLAYEHKQPFYIPHQMADSPLFLVKPGMDRYVGATRGKDEFGVEWIYDPLSGAPMPVPGQYLFEDICDWKEKMIFPDLDAVDWEKQAEEDLRVDLLALNAGKGFHRLPDGKTNAPADKLHRALIVNGLFERMHACMGFENAFIALMTEPEACYDFFSALVDFRIAHFKKIVQYYPVDVINFMDDYGSADRMLFSPELFRAQIKPHLKRLVDACHELGVLYQHHSCGYIEPIFEDFVELGVDAIDPLQGCNKNLAMLKAKYGDRITFCGGLDNQGIIDQPGVTEEAIRAEYRRVVDTLAPGGSYIMGAVSANRAAMPILMDEHMHYGRTFYQRG